MNAFFFLQFAFIRVIIDKVMTTRRITKNAILLALLCVTGMFSVPLGENIKVSLQLLTIFLIFGITDKLVDKIIIPALYLLLGLVAPIYAGFQVGVTPTFGFVISFVVIAVPFHFLYKYIKLKWVYRYIIACLVSLIIVYLIGSLFMMFYLNISYTKSLMLSVVPYIGFDILKIAICTTAIHYLPESIKTDQRFEQHDQ